MLSNLNLLAGQMLVNVNGEATTIPGKILEAIWNAIGTSFKEVGGFLAIICFVASSIYFFRIGKDDKKLDVAKGIMLSSLVGLVVVYFGEYIIDWFIGIIDKIDPTKAEEPTGTVIKHILDVL